MANAGRVGLGTLSGATGGASLGTAILPGWGTAIGAGVGGLAGLIGGLVDDPDDDQEERRRQAMALLQRRQGIESDSSKLRDQQALYSMYGGNGAMSNALSAPRRRGLEARGQQLERDQLNANMQPQDDTSWRDWVGPLLGAGAAAAGAFKGGDPLASRRAQLNGTSDEADYIRSQNLSPDQLKTALDENDGRTRSALFGPRTRMSAYDF